MIDRQIESAHQQDFVDYAVKKAQDTDSMGWYNFGGFLTFPTINPFLLKYQLDKERRMQEAQLAIKRRFGKNAILKGLNFEEGATAKERNEQIGGHKA